MKPNSRQLEVIRSLREERKKQNLSMLTLTRKLGHKSNGSVWAFEHGRDYSDKFANRLAEALGVKIDLAPKPRSSMAPAPLTPQDRIRIGDMIKAKREELKLSRADVSRLADLPGFVIAHSLHHFLPSHRSFSNTRLVSIHRHRRQTLHASSI